MSKRLLLMTLLLTVPLLAAATGPETFTSFMGGPNATAVEWLPATGPLDPDALVDDVKAPQGLTVHEWGTFTSVAGPDGQAIDWLPAGGPTDLPCFVVMSDPSGGRVKGGIGPNGQRAGRTNEGKIRMETPVLYFYSPREQTISAKVTFPHGLMTEWYPAAKVGPSDLFTASNNLVTATGSIEWTNVKVMPGATENYPLEPGSSHYYAARQTGSAPLQVGTQHEKFLFYRGIASFNPPIAAQVTRDGKIAVTNLGEDEIPNIVLFENRGGKIGYRTFERLSNFRGKGTVSRPITLDPPELTSNFQSLQRDLERILQAQGMYPREARAMVDTWKDTWFEQGTRIFYIVPSRTVDSILPLEVKPAPVSIARAFVGRMEVITSATQNEVRTAIAKNDKSTMETYGRFLEPILDGFLGKRLTEAERAQAKTMTDTIRAGYMAKVTACRAGRTGAW